jgi:predicted  nucleic acid-binding Zn-ribbon protein
MITLTDLKTCENCGNIFSKKLLSKIINRCPACNVWKKQDNEE